MKTFAWLRKFFKREHLDRRTLRHEQEILVLKVIVEHLQKIVGQLVEELIETRSRDLIARADPGAQKAKMH